MFVGKQRTRIVSAYSLVYLLAAASYPQDIVSPHETTSATVDGVTVTVSYGRPKVRGRKIFGSLIPFKSVWRTGADAATSLKTDKNILLGDRKVLLPAGEYSLFTLVDQDAWILIVSKRVGQWGTEYDPRFDYVRVTMKIEHLDKSIEQNTIAIEKHEGGGGVLNISWENTRASVLFRKQE